MAEVGEGKGGGAGGGEAPASRRPPARPRLASPSPRRHRAPPPRAPPSPRPLPPLRARAPVFHSGLARPQLGSLHSFCFYSFSPPSRPVSPAIPAFTHCLMPAMLPSSPLERAPPLTLSTPSGALGVRGPLPAFRLVCGGGWDKWGILRMKEARDDYLDLGKGIRSAEPDPFISSSPGPSPSRRRRGLSQSVWALA